MKKFLYKTGVSLGVVVIYIYRIVIRPFNWSTCRFDPTCSEYTKQAIEKYGLWKGINLGIQRIVSCHPFSKKPPYDPIP